MYKSNNQYSSLIKSHRLYTSLFSTIILFILAIFFAGQVYGSHHNYKQKVAPDFTLSHKNCFSKAHFYYPVKPGTIPYEQENSDDNDYSEDFNENFSSLNFNVVDEDIYPYSFCIRSRFYQLAQSVHKRPVVALFIMHHSWKSFLC